MSTLKATKYHELASLTGPRGHAVVGHNTVASFWEGGRVVVKLHKTNIAMVMSSGVVAIRHGGYPTTTTFDRLQQLVPDGWRVTRRNADPAAVWGTDKVSIFAYDWLLLATNGRYKYSVLDYPDWESAPELVL